MRKKAKIKKIAKMQKNVTGKKIKTSEKITAKKVEHNFVKKGRGRGCTKCIKMLVLIRTFKSSTNVPP